MADDLESIELRPVVANDQVVPDDYEVIWRGLTIGRMMKQADSAYWWWSCNVHGQPSTANDRGPAINFKDSQLRFKLAWTKIRSALTEDDIATALSHAEIRPGGFAKRDAGALLDLQSKRAAARHRVLKSGTIEFNGGAIDCVVRNLSDTGAALEVASPLGIPAAFNLLIAGERTTYQCEVRWRKENRIGVAFSRS
jgi:PilZ domain